MQAFDIHSAIVNEYTEYLQSFIHIKDQRIKQVVDRAFKERRFLPDGMVQFNPAYAPGPSLQDLENEGVITQGLRTIFGNYNLHHHQVEALRMGARGESFIVTSGTGSGKSLTYLSTIFNAVLKAGPDAGLQAIVVYPMNALINSQEEEIKKFEINWLRAQAGDRAIAPGIAQTLDEEIELLKGCTEARFPVSYGKYTGQESGLQRDRYKTDTPHILLTNYMMLELIMTRNGERWVRDAMQADLQFLVFDELHTYRGRQGSDVSMLIRRIHAHCGKPLVCIGTSATMTTGGDRTSRKTVVANAATQLFSQPFSPEQVVEERLTTTTVLEGQVPMDFDLQECIAKGIDSHAGSEAFLRHPLAIWLENRVAVERLPDGDLQRGRPMSLHDMSALLAKDSGEELETCAQALRQLLQWAERLNVEASKQRPRKSYLPFKIHQFISQLGNVYVTLEPSERRTISLDIGRYIKGDGGDRPIFPVMFSRGSGHAFICVRKRESLLVPRDPDDLPERILKGDLKGDKALQLQRRKLTEDDFPDGYILLPDDDEEIWKDSDVELLPENWMVSRKGKLELDNYYEHCLPRKIYFDAEGHFSHEGGFPYCGWFIAARLQFDPTSGVVYDGRTREHNKLMRLGNEGRSTATTILSFGVIKALNAKQIPAQSQKLLSFTDNRQDASLQAGHFNDFLMLARLRSAIYHALKEADGNCLEIDQLPSRVVKRLALLEQEYAREPSQDPTWRDERCLKALKDFVTIRMLYDLKRGWRYNTPNLEQCALLEIGYEGLAELCENDAVFAGIELFSKISPTERYYYLTQILNHFRTSYAFQFHKLEGSELEDMVDSIHNKLDPDKLWSLDKDERVETPTIMLARSVGVVQGRVYTSSIGPLSSLAKYLRRIFKQHGIDPLKGEAHSDYLESLCEVLKGRKILKEITVRGEKGTAKGYRIYIEKVIWKLGNGRDVINDEVRVTMLKQLPSKPNSFFRKLYQQDFNLYERPLLGREHTGQLSNADRTSREEGFRKGEIAALFCSPTMELGIDIHELNVVHMRNVPPSPANYAQRSGRAGRSGQAALVFTYCANGSPHDRNYFKNSTKMISGQVVAPKIDLSNEELIRTHFHAYLLMELGLSDLNMSAVDVLDMKNLPSLPLRPEISHYIAEQLAAFGDAWRQQFGAMLHMIPALQTANWYNEDWLKAQVKGFLPQLDKSFDRWRAMYLTANRMVEQARATLDDTSITSDAPAKQEAKRDHAIGMRRRAILLNSENRSFGGESEFYVYRYLAAEGLLPGYGFTRLPVRTFLGHRHLEQGEFISRPRFVALREFGPRSLVYHNGGKYEVQRIHLAKTDTQRQHIKISKATGYAFLGEAGQGMNNDPITKAALSGQDFVEIYNDLLPMEESDARPKERISCEEEERSRAGYVIEQYFAFGKGISATKQAQICEAKEPLLNLIYDQAAQLIQINHGWKRSKKADGFPIGLSSGRWKMVKDLHQKDPDEEVKPARLFATDTSDILYLQPVHALGLDAMGVTTLAYALKRGIERKFQIEEREITVWMMGTGEHRNILIYEAAEGSLGILSQLVENANDLQDVFAEAYKALHFDLATGEDRRTDLPKASYEDLLSYYNQRDHEWLDRHAVKTALERLMKCSVDNQKGNKSVEEQYQYLMGNYDLNSATERKLIEFLYAGGYALPDRAQFQPKECLVSADFAYKTEAGYTLVFCDGSIHDTPEVQAADIPKRECASNYHDIIVWHHSEPMEALVARRKDIFRKIR